MLGVGFYLEENRQEILGRFVEAAQAFGSGQPALSLAAPVLLQDLARAMRSEAPPSEPWKRSMMLVASQPPGGLRGLVREFGALRRAIWEAFSARGHPVPAAERRAVDAVLDEALACAAERWATMVRLFTPRTPEATPVRPTPPPLPRRRMKVPNAVFARAPGLPPLDS